ncbi:MAG: hypothetical protein QOH92_186 [Chloroflexota bacterium]|jgi:hypothetical protein|nr:hypothetical protein [Chloroflexota bacterium]
MAEPRKTKAKHAERIKQEVEKRRTEAEKNGEQFTSLTDDQLQKKLRRTRSPMIVWQSWTGSTTPGGVINYSLGIYNPDPTTWVWLFVHLFVGAANMVADPNDAVVAVDSRFPRLTAPDFAGLSVDPGKTQSLSFSLPIPGNAEPTDYLGNSFLFHSVWHDTGQYLDRSLFVFKVG